MDVVHDAPQDCNTATAMAAAHVEASIKALEGGNTEKASASAYDASQLLKDCPGSFSMLEKGRIFMTYALSLHAKSLTKQLTSDRDDDVPFSKKESLKLLNSTKSYWRRAHEAFARADPQDHLLLAVTQSGHGLALYDISLQRGRYRKSGLTEKLTQRKRAMLRQQGLGEMRAAAEQLRTHPQPATSQRLEVYLNLVSCCGVLERGRYIVEAIEQCDDLGISRKYALAHLLGRRAITKSLAKFYAAHTPVPAPKETTP